MAPAHEIDIQENSLRHRGDLLDILLIDRTTGKNIIWATDSYEAIGKDFAPKKHIKKELVTGEHGELIQPRAAKPLSEQKQRTRDKAEVFTPVKVVDKMNKIVDWSSDTKLATSEGWRTYVSKTMLEISCGEAPFIVSRYNPTAHTGKLIKLSNRVGFLDRKLRVVSKFCDTPREWIKWAKQAYKASYGYEWQGDNLLIARENLLYTLIDYYEDKFKRKPSLDILRSFAEIISWNIFQMDGLKYVIPKSCEGKATQKITQISILPVEEEKQEQLSICEGCTTGNASKHAGKYVRIMDWALDETNRFVDILS
ncbi:restriction endonuclease subunit M [Candidatus Saccharibacteria bacterium]|nr:restriction endonuclease subunit M [Candidatus Saccharibacteria bacterium]